MATEIPDLGKHYLDLIKENFQGLKTLADKALAQINDEQYHWQPDPESNSIAIIMKHISGNMISRWSDFLTSDGEKPDRNRDQEFIDNESLIDLRARWTTGWQVFFETLNSLTATDLIKTVYIRTEPHTVMQAINRQLLHYGYHVGQIVYLAKHLQSSNWRSLSIPRNRSAEYLAQPWKEKPQ